MKTTNAAACMNAYRQNRTSGYTIDQTILIVAIIAILITMIVATVGWNLINKSGGAKLAAQVRQVEDSIGRFFSTHGVQLHQGITTMTQDQSVRALMNDLAAVDYTPAVDQGLLENMLPGFSIEGTTVLHGFGGGGATSLVQSQVNTLPASTGLDGDIYYVVQFRNVTVDEAEEADKIIDGAIDSQDGRVFYNVAGVPCMNATEGAAAAGGAAIGAANTVEFCYAANIVTNRSAPAAPPPSGS